MNSMYTGTNASEPQETQDPALSGNTPSETSADVTGNDPTETVKNTGTPVDAPKVSPAKLSRYDQVRLYIEAGDAAGLQDMLYGGKDPTKFSPYGGIPRETISVIAQRPEYHAELVKLATNVAARWANPVSLARMIVTAYPHLHLLETPDNPMSIPEIQEMAGRFSELSDPEALILLQNLYFRKNQLLQIPQGFEEHLCTWVVESQFFSNWRQALLCLAQFIPDPLPPKKPEKLKLAFKQKRWQKANRKREAQVARRAVEKALKKPQSDRQSHDVGDQETALLPPYATDFGDGLTPLGATRLLTATSNG